MDYLYTLFFNNCTYRYNTIKIVNTAGLPFTGIALKVPEPYAVKVARTVLRGRKLPGAVSLKNAAPLIVF